MSLRSYIRDYFSKPMVRPWALSAPVLVLVLCLPMLRPLRHPADISGDEALQLATISALSHHDSLALDRVPAQASASQILHVRDRIYADQPPLLAVLLAWPTWVMARIGYPIEENSALVVYILTLLAVTLPVAGAAGLLYRMGRLFELPRPWRAALACGIVFGSGLVSYAVVLNPHAPAAVLVLCAAACLIHVSLGKLPKRGIAWVMLSGVCAALAATLDPPAGLIALLLLFVIATIRMPVLYRLAAMLLFAIGAAVPIAAHAAWSRPITGEIVPGWRHMNRLLALAPPPEVAVASANDEPDADDIIAGHTTPWSRFEVRAEWFGSALTGAHGVLSHFPVLLIGFLGIGAVMHRHWPGFVKSLAAASAIGAILIVALYASAQSDWHDAMFASRWFVVFLPLLLFWSGAWLRRPHSHLSWSIAGLLLAFSIFVTMVGTTEPYPPGGFDHYTAGQALRRAMHSSTPVKEVIAGAAIPR